MLLRKLLLTVLFLSLLSGFSQAAIVEYVSDGDFKIGFDGWLTDPKSGDPTEYVSRVNNDDPESDWAEIGFREPTPGSQTNSNIPIDFVGRTFTGRIQQKLANRPNPVSVPDLDSSGKYKVSFKANMVDFDNDPNDADYLQFLFFTFKSGNPADVYAANIPEIKGTGSGATGFIDYNFTVDLSDWMLADGDPFVGFYFNEVGDEANETTYARITDVSVTNIPVPGAFLLLGSGLLGLIGWRRKFQK